MSELRFDGRVAVVTGAGRGLGRAHALLLASRGAKVVVNDPGGAVTGEDADGAGPAQDVVAEIRALGGEAVADTHSVATPDGGAAIVAAAVGAWGRLDVVVNNAGIVRDALFDDMTDDVVTPLVDVHLLGAFHVTRPAWAVMKEQGYGRIVNTTSAAGVLGVQNMSNYGSAKTGLIGLTRCLGIEGEPFGIKVNALAPVAATRMLEKSLASAGAAAEADPEIAAMLDRVAKAFATRLDPALVASAVAFLAHEECPVTGEIYSAGGGQVSRFFIGRTAGFHDPELSPESVRDHFDRIRSEDGYSVPGSSGDEMASLFEVLGITLD